jgi:arylsulfatase A-like enzyme
MPFMVRWPGRVPAGRVDDVTVFGAVDLLPTLCAISGSALPEATALDGENLSAALFGKEVVRKNPLFWEYGRNNKAFKYPAGRDRSPNLAVRDGSWKLLVNADGSGTELYDLSADRNETSNVAGQHHEIAKRLTTAVLEWRKNLP